MEDGESSQQVAPVTLALDNARRALLSATELPTPPAATAPLSREEASVPAEASATALGTQDPSTQQAAQLAAAIPPAAAEATDPRLTQPGVQDPAQLEARGRELEQERAALLAANREERAARARQTSARGGSAKERAQQAHADKKGVDAPRHEDRLCASGR